MITYIGRVLCENVRHGRLQENGSSSTTTDAIHIKESLRRSMKQGGAEDMGMMQRKIIQVLQLCTDDVSLALRKLGLMHERKVSSQTSLCSLHRLIRNHTFRLKLIFGKEGHP
ncbi:hypothetical protein DPMN_070159 [Dreissena polymorpha]|uniref:Uncharacterized protein n=1 Tax=Dreissena polymorpha TaxID=45954 RepID=A0A9D3Z0T4_DREPO|nr:hypothetical protein DPMN_070159 [Dreissena polymorpha]